MHGIRVFVANSRLLTYYNQVALSRSPAMAYSVRANNQDEVLFDASGSARVITLNRPKALNALNLNMVERLLTSMKDWIQSGSQVSHIVMKGAGEKAFCAGGDIKAVTDEGKKDPESLKATHFFRREYILNHMIGTCPIPFVALIDGITMGGGVGLSVHAPFRVATERTLFAMPETAIGLFPDVGGSYFLSRLPGAEGLYLALTGFRLKAEDVHKAGIATHYITHEGGLFEEMKSELLLMKNATRESIDELLTFYHNKCATNKEFVLAPQKQLIDEIFSYGNSLEDIYSGLEKEGSEWSKKTLATLTKMSPTSMKVTIEQLRRGKSMSLADCLKMELRICRTVMLNQDFYEGVRALLVDKDNNPSWVPRTIEKVSDNHVLSFFKQMPEGAELEFEV